MNEVVDDLQAGKGCTASCRAIGNMMSLDDRMYTLSVMITCDDDSVGFDPDLPILEPDTFKSGKGVVTAPDGYFPSAEKLER